MKNYVGNIGNNAEGQTPSYNDLHNGKFKLLETANEGTCQLWRNTRTGIEYVVLCDNSVITREEDNDTDAIFPHNCTTA
jgi:hypothetical protein